ncbi:hypothetical protein L7F22_042759 [Adiantum nelumboides]|nr:hypothetical protein [Adiantum nelumboides]
MQRPPRRGYMWSDKEEHQCWDSDDFNEAYKKNVVFWKDNKIHLKATGKPLRLSFVQSGIKKIANEIQHNVALVDAATFGLQVYSKADVDDFKAYGDLWTYALKLANMGKAPLGSLSKVGNCIRETTGWFDPVDSHLIYAYIAKSKANEAMVEEKQKRDEEIAGSSKRATKASSKKEEGTLPKPTPKVNMEDAPKEKKQGKPRGPSYILKSDIELATDLKKGFEERLLNSKVEVTLGDILGIAKCKFHEKIIGIIKRKCQISSDQELEAVKSQVGLKKEYYLEELERVPKHSFIKWFQAKKRRTGKSIVEDSHEGFKENDTIEKIVEKPKVLSSPTSMDSTMEDLFKGQSILTNLGSARMEKNADEMISTKSTHVMEICKDDNEEAGDTIQKTTGRTNPVDSLLEVQVNKKFMEEKQKVEEEILKVQTDEAFVKDKRNNEEEILEISKGQSRASIRTNGEQMPKATPSPKAQIKDASKDKKQSKVCGPSFKLICDIELATALKVFKELIDNKVKVTWRDILG